MTLSRWRLTCPRGLRSESGHRALARSTTTPSGFANSVQRAFGRREATASQTTSWLHDPSFPRSPHRNVGARKRIRQCNSHVKSRKSFSLYNCIGCTKKERCRRDDRHVQGKLQAAWLSRSRTVQPTPRRRACARSASRSPELVQGLAPTESLGSVQRSSRPLSSPPCARVYSRSAS